MYSIYYLRNRAMSFTPPSSHEIQAFQRRIWQWYAKHRRSHLPWRTRISPYRVLVSEVMLQQTQVDRVIPKYMHWMKRFSSWKALARAPRVEVLRAWSGLGYNSRAVRLQETARIVVERYHGRLPRTDEQLLRLPGIGPYTSRSVQIFTWNVDTVCIDTNIRRVLIHELELPDDLNTVQIEEIAWRCLPSGMSREWHSALMDYGALHSTARKTGIASTSKQSTFEGSFRQAKATVLKKVIGVYPKELSWAQVRVLARGHDVGRITTALLKDRSVRETKSGLLAVDS